MGQGALFLAFLWNSSASKILGASKNTRFSETSKLLLYIAHSTFISSFFKSNSCTALCACTCLHQPTKHTHTHKTASKRNLVKELQPRLERQTTLLPVMQPAMPAGTGQITAGFLMEPSGQQRRQRSPQFKPLRAAAIRTPLW